MFETIALKTSPEIRRVVTAAFPGYKKHNAFLATFGEHGVSVNNYWDGGSREEFAVVELATMQRRSLPTSTHPYYDIARKGMCGAEDNVVAVDHVGNVTLKVLPEGFALIRAGYFCGKPATATVFLNPANMAKLIGH